MIFMGISNSSLSTSTRKAIFTDLRSTGMSYLFCYAVKIPLCLSKLMHKMFYNAVRAFHHYREARDNNEPLNKNPELERLLREEFRSLDDFRRAKEKSKVKDDNKPIPA